MVEPLQLIDINAYVKTSGAPILSAHLTPRRNVAKLFGHQRHDVANLALYQYVICLTLKRLNKSDGQYFSL